MTPDQERISQAFTLMEAGDLAAAESTCRDLLVENPSHFHARHLLGVILTQDDRLEEGMRYIRAVISDDPSHPGPHRNLGAALLHARRFDEAADSLRRALTIDPSSSQAWNNLGLVYRQLGQLPESTQCFRQALAITPDAPDTLNNLAIVLMLGPESDEAIPLLERAIRLAPDYEDSYSNLASFYEKSNRIADAEPTIETGLERFPDNPLLHLLAAKLERRTGKEAQARARLEELEKRKPPLSVEKGLNFELGKILDRVGEADEAFQRFQKGNRLAIDLWDRNLQVANPFVTELEALARRLSPQALSAWPALDLPAPEQNPVFLIGFFRSGTTLLDTILGSHGQFQVLEERPTVNAVSQALYQTPESYPEKLFHLTSQDVIELRKIYFSAVDREIKREPGKVLIDKFPANTASVALIHRLFPDARFIFALRHPCDVCLSCYMQDFGETEFMVNFADLENTAKVYARVMDLWRIYEANLPIHAHILKYEDVVENLEDQMRQLLSFLQVEWSDTVLSHAEHALQRGRIRTPSYHQVAQPVYQHASYRWQRYESHLAPIMSILEPAIEYFGYDQP